jgi:site-specific DNA recombinase
MRIAIYVRVSTQRQAQTQTIEQQVERLRAHGSGLGERLADDDICRDDGYSGASLRRPGLDRLRDRAALASFDRLYVTDPDRRARNYVHQALLIEERQRHGCQVASLDRPMSRDPHDQSLLHIRGAVAAYERTLIAERTRRGRQHKFRTGQLLPWTRPPYGYRLDPERPPDPSGVRLEPAEAAVVAEMFAWYVRDGHTLLGLVKQPHELGVPSPSGQPYWGLASVRGVLANPSYTGQVYAGRTRYRPAQVRRSATHPLGRPHETAEPVPAEEWVAVGASPAMVTRAQLDLARAKLATNQTFARRDNTAASYLLRALLSCGHCGLACQARRAPPEGRYYVCTGNYLQVRQRTGTTCTSRFVPAAQVADLVWQGLCDLVQHPAVVAQARRRAAGGHWLPQEWQSRRDGPRRGRARLAQQLERLTEASLGDIIPLPEYQRRRADLERRQEALARREEQLGREADRLSAVAGLVSSAEDFCRRVAAGLAGATFEQRRQLVERLIDRVVVTGDEVAIRYAIPTDERGEHTRFCPLRVDYFRTPHPVGPLDAHVPQPIRVDPRPGPGGPPLRLGVERLQPPQPQQPRHPLAVDRFPGLDQPLRQPPATADGVGGVLPVDQPHQPQVLLARGGRLVVQASAAQPQEFALPAHTQLRVVGFDPGPQPLRRAAQLFFEPLQLHLEAADLLEQLGLRGRGVGRGGLAAVGEDLVGAGEQLLLPGVEQSRVDSILTRQLVAGLIALEGGQGHRGLEGRRVLLALAGHRSPFPGPPQ